MTTEGSRLERFLVSVARVASGSGLHPLLVLQAVETEARRTTSEGRIANAYTVELNPGDAGAFAGGTAEMSRAVISMLADHCRASGLTTLGPLDVEFAASSTVPSGTVRVQSAFRAPTVASGRAIDGRQTQAITRQRNKWVVIDGVGRAAMRHTPFVIGRSPECDLTVADFSVSRRHAVIDQASNGQFFIRDLGSRNRIVCDGVTGDEFAIETGQVVTLGSTRLWLEEDV